MSLKWKVNIVEALKDKGFTSYEIRKKKLLGEGTLTKLRNGEGVSWENLGVICDLLGCEIEDVVVNIKEPKEDM